MSDTTGGASSESHVGTVLTGGYELLELLGGGGMGVVYKAKRVDFDNFVAVKLLHNSVDSDLINLQRLQREAQVLGALDHPAIPKVHSIKLMADGGIFIAIDYIEGRSLQHELDQHGKLSHALAVLIALQIADALKHAHEQGVVHRDLKPANIMLSGADEAMQVHVLDFGIAKKLETSQQFTRTGAIVGTAYYMSPEQARGEHVDQRCDVYALGCVLYEMLTGRRLFDGANQMEVLLRHVQETLPELNVPEIGPYVGVLAKALAKDPNERFQSMGEMETAIRAPDGVKSRRIRRFSKWSRNAVAATVIGSVAAAVLIGLTKTQPTVVAPMDDAQISSIIKKAWSSQDYGATGLDEAIAAAAAPNRDGVNGKHAIDLDLAGLIRLGQRRVPEAQQLLRLSLKQARLANQAGIAIAGLAAIEQNPEVATEMIKRQLDADDARGLGSSDSGLKLRMLLAQKYEGFGKLPEAAFQYKVLMNRAANDYRYRSIGCIGCADMLSQMGSREEASALILPWINDNESAEPAWEFMPSALNVRAATMQDLAATKSTYELARKMAAVNMKERTGYLADHSTTSFRLWRAKAVAEVGLAKVAFLEKRFTESEGWMNVALETCKQGNDPTLGLYLRKQRVVKP